MPTNEILYLSRADLEYLNFNMVEIISIVEKAFKEKGLGDVEMPPKPGIHTAQDAFIHAMPAYIPAMKAAGIKWVSGYPENYKRGLPYISGLLIMNDPDTGIPISVMDASWITSKRTGAATAVAAKYLARPESKTLAILGCGLEGRTNLEALGQVLKNLEEVRAYDISTENQERYVKEMSAKHQIMITGSKNPREAVEGADAIVTAGPILKHPNPAIERAWLKNGLFACPIDFDSYWKPEAMHSMDKFIADDEQQLLYYKTSGYFQDIPQVFADLGEVVVGKKTGRANENERIMAMNLGLAIEDVAVAKSVYEEARSRGTGKWLRL
jgi:ornithine cyclodeaminase/alanine dehydrogenase-like protein (mu-crystallin family)